MTTTSAHWCWSAVLGIASGILMSSGSILAQDATPPARDIPSAEAVAELLKREPMTPANWPAWRARLLAWIADRSHQTDAAYAGVRAFMKAQAGAQDELTGKFADDALAWYFLGSAHLHDAFENRNSEGGAARAERAVRYSIRLDPSFARTHRLLAIVLFLKGAPPDGPDAGRPRRGAILPPPANAEAFQALDEARRLDPSLPVTWVEAQGAYLEQRYFEAERLFQKALEEEPGEANLARGAAMAILMNPHRPGSRAGAVKTLLDRFPNDGELVCLHAVALASDKDFRAAARELQRARALGVNPQQFLPPQVIQRIEEEAAPGWLETFTWTMVAFGGFYALVMSLMSLAGLILARFTRGNRALTLLGVPPEDLVSSGQVVRTSSESSLARLYALSLVLGLILFYLAIPFIIAGLLGLTALVLYLVFMLPRIPIKLLIIVFIAGGGAALAVLKSVFTRAAQGSFGLPKTSADCPRVYQLLADVARLVDTTPVDEVYVAPGSAIGVHQEGRGPFGMFGVKRRVLTLGLSTMRFLTVSELQAILAHEYAHFSHRDTFYSRFIYQVDMSIEKALGGMGQAGGYLNYVNPFFWFLYLYYKAYSLLSAGFSRSREFLADRMASSLFGSDVFTSALTKVATDGALFEMTIYQNIAHLLEQEKAFVNMYSAFHEFRNQGLNAQEREDFYRRLLEAKGSLFASHPTFGERIEAVAPLPRAAQTDATPALQLFENPEETEKELTEFLTGYVFHVRQLEEAAHRS